MPALGMLFKQAACALLSLPESAEYALCAWTLNSLQPPIPCGNHRHTAHRAGAFLVFFSPPKTCVAAVSAVRRLWISLRETTAPREVPVHVAFSSLHYLYCHVLTHSAVRRVHALKSSNRHNATLTASKSVLSYVNNKFSRTTSTSDDVPCCLV
jgi:hypothetical protein